MNSFTELNSASALTLDVTDSRGSKVIFDRVLPLQPLNQTNNIASTTVTVNPGIEIVEIVNYATANVRYRVTIRTGGSPLLTGSSISWASVPAGMTLVTAGNVYTISGIDNVTEWNAIKSFTWTLPANFATRPNWYLEVAVLYYDSVRAEEMVVDWEVYDEDFYYVAELSSAASISANGTRVKQLAAALTGAGGFVMTILRAKNFTVSMSSAFSMTPVPVEDLLFAFTNVVASARVTKRSAANLTTTATMTAAVSEVASGFTPRTYTANTNNLIFASNTPQIGDTDPATTATFTFSLTGASGGPAHFFIDNNYGTPVTTYVFSGTLAQVNAKIPQIQLLPVRDVSSNGSYTFNIQKDAVSLLTRTVSLTGTANTYVAPMYTFTSSQTYQPLSKDVHFSGASTMTLVVVGGGGAGGAGLNGYAGAGGGGGGVLVNNIFPPQLGNHTIVIGAGGQRGAATQGVTTGTAGGTTTFTLPDTTVYTATGGQPGSNFRASAGGGIGGVSGFPSTAGSTTGNSAGPDGGKFFGVGGGGAGGVGGLMFTGGTTDPTTGSEIDGPATTLAETQGDANGGIGTFVTNIGPTGTINKLSYGFGSGGGGGGRQVNVSGTNYLVRGRPNGSALSDFVNQDGTAFIYTDANDVGGAALHQYNYGAGGGGGSAALTGGPQLGGVGPGGLGGNGQQGVVIIRYN